MTKQSLKIAGIYEFCEHFTKHILAILLYQISVEI